MLNSLAIFSYLIQNIPDTSVFFDKLSTFKSTSVDLNGGWSNYDWTNLALKNWAFRPEKEKGKKEQTEG